MDKRRVVITGMGIVSPLSLQIEEFWNRLTTKSGGVRPWTPEGGTTAPIEVAAPALFSGKIADFDSRDASQQKAIRKGLKVMSREIQMAVAASCRALNDAEISIGQFPADRVGISFGSDYIITTVEDVLDGMRACFKRVDGSVDCEEKFDFSLWAERGKPKMAPLWQLKYLPNMPGSHIAILNDFHGPSNSITLREASIGACIGESIEIIASNRVDVMLVGTTGSRLHPFKLIHAVEQEELAKSECRPFDRERSGTVLGEGAGAFVLEEYEHAVRRGATIWAEVVCGSYRAQYTKQRSDRRREVVGAVLRDVLRRGRMEPEQIGHLNAHGLGGSISDRVEAQGIADVFGARKTPIPVTAAKGFFGNLGAGGGAVELVAGVMALHHGNLFSSLRHETTDPECPVSIAAPGTPAGDTFIKLAMNPQAQASAVLLRKI